MRIVEIREKTVSIASAITNAYIDFSKMTLASMDKILVAGMALLLVWIVSSTKRER